MYPLPGATVLLQSNRSQRSYFAIKVHSNVDMMIFREIRFCIVITSLGFVSFEHCQIRFGLTINRMHDPS